MQIGTNAPAITFDRKNGIELIVERETNLNTHTGERRTYATRYVVTKNGVEIWSRDAMVCPAEDAANWKSVTTFFHAASLRAEEEVQ